MKNPGAVKTNIFPLAMISLVATTDEGSHQPHTHTHTTKHRNTHMAFYSSVGSPVTDPDQSYELLYQRV